MLREICDASWKVIATRFTSYENTGDYLCQLCASYFASSDVFKKLRLYPVIPYGLNSQVEFLHQVAQGDAIN